MASEEVHDTPAMALVTAGMAATSLWTVKECIQRPGFGEGRTFPVWCNAFEVTPPELIAYHYEVKILPDKPATPPRLHHMSFFPMNDMDADRRNHNWKAGTTIDTEITSTYSFDWCLQSHASLLGTGRSATTPKFSANVLKQLVFNLCFTYARCTRSVSYATPAYYADRVCTRSQLLLKRDFYDSSTVISSHSGVSEEEIRNQQLAEYTSRLKAIHENHKKILFFM